jgi:hypothetical protein
VTGCWPAVGQQAKQSWPLDAPKAATCVPSPRRFGNRQRAGERGSDLVRHGLFRLGVAKAVLPCAGSAGWVFGRRPCRRGVLRQNPGLYVLPGGSSPVPPGSRRSADRRDRNSWLSAGWGWRPWWGTAGHRAVRRAGAAGPGDWPSGWPAVVAPGWPAVVAPGWPAVVAPGWPAVVAPGRGLAGLGAAPSGFLACSPGPAQRAGWAAGICCPVRSGASPRGARACIQEWLLRQRPIMIKAAIMISTLHSATSMSSTLCIGQPPGMRSHLALYPLSPCRTGLTGVTRPGCHAVDGCDDAG